MKFLENVENRIQGLYDKIGRLQNSLEEGKTMRAKGVLRGVENKINRFKERIAEGELEDMLDELDDAVDEIYEGLEDLNGEGTSALLGEMNKLEARIRVLQATAERLARKGEDTSGVEEELDAAEKLLEEIFEELEEGDLEAAEELLEEAEERTRYVSENIGSSKGSELKKKLKIRSRSRHGKQLDDLKDHEKGG